MRKRNKRVEVHLSEDEYEHLKKQVGLSSCSSTEQFLRALIAGQAIRPKPPDCYLSLLHEMSAIGNNINQIAHTANTKGFVRQFDVKAIEQMQMQLWKAVKAL